ncbi:hypothetical protein DdX_21137 [Ditylenchus destructor]|uniref:Uncharacterized protein n=1 Tax=Ditylenchus destructor TaxID=166010 RepID=A0AAD4QVT8_9BILA|nr:hypothetical protein DdX_21137 [Ditylenchus destructor]
MERAVWAVSISTSPQNAQFDIILGYQGCAYEGHNETLIACFDGMPNRKFIDGDEDEVFELREICKQVGKSDGFKISLFNSTNEEGRHVVRYRFVNMAKRTASNSTLLPSIKFADVNNAECRDVENKFKFISQTQLVSTLLYCVPTQSSYQSRTFDIYLYPAMCEPLEVAKTDHLIAKVYFDKKTIANCTRSDTSNDNCNYKYSIAFDNTKTLYPHHGVKYPTSADDAKLYGGTFFAYNVIREKAINSSTDIIPKTIDTLVSDNVKKVPDELASVFIRDYYNNNSSAVDTLYEKFLTDFNIMNMTESDIREDRLLSVNGLMRRISQTIMPYFKNSSKGIQGGNIAACFKSNSSDFGKEIGKAVVVSAPISDTERMKVAKKAGKDYGKNSCKGVYWRVEQVTEMDRAKVGREEGIETFQDHEKRVWNVNEAGIHNDTNNVYGVWMNHSAFDSFNDALHTFYVDLGAEFSKFFFQKLSSEGSQILSAVVGEEIASRVGDQLNKFIAKDLEKEVQTQKPVEKIIGAMRDRLKKDFDALFANENSSTSLIPTLEFLRNASFTAFKHMNDTIKREPIPYTHDVRQFVYVFHGVRLHTGFVQGFTNNPDVFRTATDICLAKSHETTFCETDEVTIH